MCVLLVFLMQKSGVYGGALETPELIVRSQYVFIHSKLFVMACGATFWGYFFLATYYAACNSGCTLLLAGSNIHSGGFNFAVEQAACAKACEMSKVERCIWPDENGNCYGGGSGIDSPGSGNNRWPADDLMEVHESTQRLTNSTVAHYLMHGNVSDLDSFVCAASNEVKHMQEANVTRIAFLNAVDHYFACEPFVMFNDSDEVELQQIQKNACKQTISFSSAKHTYSLEFLFLVLGCTIVIVL